MSKDNKIVRFPTGGWQRAANRRGKRSVSCVVSDRFLRFEEDTGTTDEGTVVLVNVMTDVNGTERKLSTLVVTLEQLRSVLKQYD
jgi:hypothetical protein